MVGVGMVTKSVLVSFMFTSKMKRMDPVVVTLPRSLAGYVA
ncbi:MAG: hypothetical protein G01um101429_774 [Parcubacteria group bacterium Gr01-1014_29]|nr:MAG: hypothetical protein G01um101429_774 [Parcubacteria group bacterium Gr01-1014_29]